MIESVIPNRPSSSATKTSKDAFVKKVEDVLEIKCFLCHSISQELIKHYRLLVTSEIVDDLKKRFLKRDIQRKFGMAKALFQYRMAKGNSIALQALDTIKYAKKLMNCDMPLRQRLTHLILKIIAWWVFLFC